MDIALEPLTDDLVAELRPLARRHSEFMGHGKIDWDTYLLIERAGKLRCFIARVDGKLLGCVAYIVSNDPHDSGKLIASCDCLFGYKSMDAWAYMKLIERSIVHLDAYDSVTRVVHTVVDHAYATLLKRLRLTPMATVYQKERKDGVLHRPRTKAVA